MCYHVHSDNYCSHNCAEYMAIAYGIKLRIVNVNARCFQYNLNKAIDSKCYHKNKQWTPIKYLFAVFSKKTAASACIELK